jgi:nitroreductase
MLTRMLDLTPDELLTTTRAVRKRLDLTRPVEPEVVQACIEIAVQAPSGSNSQGWHWVVVTDADLRRQIADYYGHNFDTYIDMPGREYAPGDSRRERTDRVRSSAIYLREHLHEVPVHVIPCAWGRLPAGAGNEMQAGYWGSILPAVWSFMLALRARGLGSAWTTLHLPNERDVADLLRIPYDRVTQAGLIPVAYTLGTDFRPAPRVPMEKVLHWDHW